jgi:CBS domain containing-hemolysin-like protein
MIPVSSVYFISQEEKLTPIVLDEMHKSGFSRFPVFSGNHQHVVGTLYIKDAINLTGQKSVKEMMQKEVFYIHEQKSLQYALKAFIKTKHHQFIVVNSFEEITGVISLEDVLEQVLGSNLMDEFDNFEDLRAVASVASSQLKKDRAAETV